MFIILLRFADKTRAAQHMDSHNAWVRQCVVDGVFLVVGSLVPAKGGAILAYGEPRSAIEARIAADPFVAEGIVTAEILEITPNRVNERLAFLLAA